MDVNVTVWAAISWMVLSPPEGVILRKKTRLLTPSQTPGMSADDVWTTDELILKLGVPQEIALILPRGKPESKDLQCGWKRHLHEVANQVFPDNRGRSETHQWIFGAWPKR